MNVVSPLTDVPDVTLLKVIQAEQLIQDWQHELDIDIRAELRGHSEIYLYQCNQTQLRFFYPFDMAGSGDLYQQLKKWDTLYLPDRWEHQIALQNLHNCPEILEVGCAYGAFIKTGLATGLKMQGIETNPAAVEFAQAEHLPVECIDLQTYAQQHPAKFDAVCSFQVLEHVPSPKEFLQWAIHLLKPGGKLILGVPNGDSFLKYEYNLLDMPPHHLAQWSEPCFHYLEKLLPIQLDQVLREPLAEYHVMGYLAAYGQYVRSKFPLAKLLLNHHLYPFYKTFFNASIRNQLTGQCLYVQFRKL